MSQEEERKEMGFDDRDCKVYGLHDPDRAHFNQSMIWVPAVIGLSVACGVLTTRGIQRLFNGTTRSMKPNLAGTNTSTASVLYIISINVLWSSISRNFYVFLTSFKIRRQLLPD